MALDGTVTSSIDEAYRVRNLALVVLIQKLDGLEKERHVKRN